MDSGSDAAAIVQPNQQVFLFVNKTAGSTSLSHSEGSERKKILSAARFTTRKPLKEDGVRVVRPRTTPLSAQLLLPKVDNSQAYRRRKKQSGMAHFQVVPATPRSDVVNRIQLTAHFLESYYPAGMPGRTRVVEQLRQWIEPKRGAIAFAAADCIILLHAAHGTGDEILRKQGMLKYSKVLRLLRDKLPDPETVRSDCVLGAVESMGVVEARLLESLDGDMEETKRAHSSGLYALILARGPSVLQSNMGRSILLQHLHEFLMVSLLSRKASVFGNVEWQTAFESIEHDDIGTIRQLTALGCCIPQLLEQADAIIYDNASTDVQYTDLLAELIVLENRFSRWLQDRYRRFPGSKPYSTTAPSLPILFYCQSTVLQDCYPFPVVVEHHSFMDAMAHLNYWGLLLIVRRTILDVLISHEATDSSSAFLEGSSRGGHARCNEVANLFCESIDYIYKLCKHQSMIGKQGIVAFLMAFVLPWYSYDQNEEKVEWCSRLLQFFQNEHTSLDLVETIQQTWTTKLYIGWINMAF